jgi:arylsulfatase A-like enzyme
MADLVDYKGRGDGRCFREALVLVAALALSAAGCGGGRPGEPGDSRPADGAEAAAPPRPNVVLVLADTLRADHLGAYGHTRDTSPRFDALAAGGYLFENARAQAPCTFPSANSILTGRYPNRFLGQPEGSLGIPEDIPSIAEILRGTGYSTAAISASPIVRATPGDMNPGGGFARGFERFHEACEWLDASCVNRRAQRFLDQHLPEPFFLYLHYLDPHDRYQPPEHWPRRFAGDGEGLSEAIRSGDPTPIAEALYERNDPSPATPEAMRHLADLYDEEIAWWDFQLGRLLDDLERRGVLDRTMVIVVSDHGESFFEHGFIQHCRTVFDTEIKTPLLVRLPQAVERAGEPRRIAAQAANLDVVPTILDYLEIPTEGLDLPGASLRPAIEGSGEERPPVFSAWSGHRAVVDGRYKLVVRARDGRAWLYDVLADPGETVDLSEENAREVGRLKAALREQVAAEEEARAEGGEEDAMERLRALGYLQ